MPEKEPQIIPEREHRIPPTTSTEKLVSWAVSRMSVFMQRTEEAGTE